MAVLSELGRSAEWLSMAYENVNRSPMGAAAGMGTAFPVDREAVARLLGFPFVIGNSMDAVASRDYVVHVLGGLALLGTTLTRLATDLQTWASTAYGFLDWPDNMMSTSSIMPQKRNAFVLENVRGKAVGPIGALVAVLVGFKNTPFTNSVEVGTEATGHLWAAVKSTRTALRLTDLLVRSMVVNTKRMREFVEHTDATLTTLADLLVAGHGMAFRTAHEAVARLAMEGIPRPVDSESIARRLEAILAPMVGRTLHLDRDAVSRALDPEAGMRAAAFGGGPGPASVARQLGVLSRRSRVLEAALVRRRHRLERADAELQANIAEIEERA